MSDSVKVSETSRSPVMILPESMLKTLLNERTRDLRPSLFDCDAKSDDDEHAYLSAKPARAPSHERVDDSASHRRLNDRGTDEGTTLRVMSSIRGDCTNGISIACLTKHTNNIIFHYSMRATFMA